MTVPSTDGLSAVVAHLADSTNSCSHVLNVLGRRWTTPVLLAGAGGARRFRDYRRVVTGVSDKLLSQRLTELQALGLMEREVIPTHPVQIVHRPTDSGEELVRVLLPVIDWGARNLTEELSTHASPATLTVTLSR